MPHNELQVTQHSQGRHPTSSGTSRSAQLSVNKPSCLLLSPLHTEKSEAAHSPNRSPLSRPPPSVMATPPLSASAESDFRIRFTNLFHSLDLYGSGRIPMTHFTHFMVDNGIQSTQQRLAPFYEQYVRLTSSKSAISFLQSADSPVGEGGEHAGLELELWLSILAACPPQTRRLIEKTICRQLAIPEWGAFTAQLTSLFESVRTNPASRTGKVATYIPELALSNPDWFGMSFVSVDGQTFNIGDCTHDFSVQSSSKPITYLIALEEHGQEGVHRFVGMEPSGRGFNEMVLNDSGIPHNPYINGGAIMVASLVQADQDQSTRFRYIMDTYQRASGHTKTVTFSNSTYLSEKATADRNFALGFLMQEEGAFQYGARTAGSTDSRYGERSDSARETCRTWTATSLQCALELYFQCCSITTSTVGQSIIAATLATGGVCPYTDQRVFKSENVKHALAIMLSCGMYDYSGEWAYSIGIPAKSGVSGCTMLVVPGVGGFSIYSPALDSLGNSVRSIELSKQLVRHFTFHYYDQMNGIVSTSSRKVNPLETAKVSAVGLFCSLCYCVTRGDLQGVASFLNSGDVEVNQADYDQRTALHIAASEGRLNMCKFLLAAGADLNAVDAWGNRPVDDAVREQHQAVADHLRAQMLKKERLDRVIGARNNSEPRPVTRLTA